MPVILLSAPTNDLTPSTLPGNSITFTWDDIDDYEPATLKASDLPKEFRGPTDPSAVSGVVLNKYDTWIESA